MKHFNKELVMTMKKTMKILRTQLNVGSVIMIILMVMLKLEILSYHWKIQRFCA